MGAEVPHADLTVVAGREEKSDGLLLRGNVWFGALLEALAEERFGNLGGLAEVLSCRRGPETDVVDPLRVAAQANDDAAVKVPDADGAVR